MSIPKETADWSNADLLSARSTREVIADHIQLQIAGQWEEDWQRNYHRDAVLLTEIGHSCGYDAWRDRMSALYRPVAGVYYEIESLQVQDDYALLVWKTGAAGYVAESAADSFVVVDGKIRMQTTCARVMQSDAGVGNAG